MNASTQYLRMRYEVLDKIGNSQSSAISQVANLIAERRARSWVRASTCNAAGDAGRERR